MAEKARKTPEEIKSDILSQLKSGPKTIAEISEAINSNWLTTEKFLNELKSQKLILELVSSAKMKVYRRADDLAFYGLPFSEQIRERSASLLFTIADKWQSETKKAPSKTILQKIAVELIENSNRELNDIPVLRFHYGKTLALMYEESVKEEYKHFNLTPKQNTFLSSLINKYKDMSSNEVQLIQYEKEGMEFYLEKEKNLVKSFSGKPDYKKIEASLLKLSVRYPIELDETFELFDKFIYCAISLLNLSKEEDKQSYLDNIKETFYLLWDTVTTSQFFHDAEKYMQPEKKELFNQIKLNVLTPKISNLRSLIEDLESEVNSINPGNISKSEKTEGFLHELLQE